MAGEIKSTEPHPTVVQWLLLHQNTSLDNRSDPYNDSTIIQYSILLTACMTLLCVTTVFGNGLVISAVLQFHRLRSTGNFLICSLATADIIVGLFVMPFHILRRICGFWPLGLGACDFWHSIDVLASTASIWNLCVISLDRYLAVRDPLTYRSVMPTRRAQIAVICVWLFSALLAFPSVLWWHHDSGPEIYANAQDCKFTDSFSFLVASSLLSFYIPLVIMVFAYCNVYTAAAMYEKSLRVGTKNMERKKGTVGMEMRVHRGRSTNHSPALCRSLSSAPVHANPNEITIPAQDALSIGGLSTCSESDNQVAYETVLTPTGSILVSERPTSPRSPRFKRSRRRKDKTNKQWNALQAKVHRFAQEKKAAKTLGIVMGCFICCWSPFFLFNIIDGVWPNLLVNANTIFQVTTWLGYCNSALNPIIYAWHNLEFRVAFRTLLRSICCLKPSFTRPGYTNSTRRTSRSKASRHGSVFNSHRLSASPDGTPSPSSSFLRKKWSVRRYDAV